MALNTLQDIIDFFREVADDKKLPYLWSDSLATTYANEAQTEAARRARLLKDSSTAAVCTYAVLAGAQSIALDPRVIFVRSVKIASKPLPLIKRRQFDMDVYLPGWDTSINLGDVNNYVTDKDEGKLWFDSPFPANDTVQLAVIREPLADMQLQVLTTTGTTTNTATPAVDPEIPKRYRYNMAQWLVYRAFEKQDSETNDPAKSKAGLDKFESEFGKASPAIDEVFTREHEGYDPYEGLR